jgi:uncharacterized protein
MTQLPSSGLIWLIRLYQYLLSPLLGPCCRFTPSCSAYAIEALRQYGLVRGGWLTVSRVLRCQPWHPGGFDPVPPAERYRAGVANL